MNVAYFGSSLVSAYWNGAATYYRGIIRAMAERGHQVTFYEPDAYDRQQHRDIPDPEWAKVVVYANVRQAVEHVVNRAQGSDLIVKANGVGVFDDYLEVAVLGLKTPDNAVVFWDVDAPATLDRIESNSSDPFRSLIPRYDAVFTYGGGFPVINAYEQFGSRFCRPIYNALDPSTHHPVPPSDEFAADLGFLGNRLPDRETRVEGFVLDAAERLPSASFLLGGSGWGDKAVPANVRYVGQVDTKDHNAFHCTPKADLNISRESMARYGFSPATRIFEAAGAGACMITDHWEGVIEPDEEILVAHSGAEVADIHTEPTPERAHQVGRNALRRVLSEHTYSHRIRELEETPQGQRLSEVAA